MTKQEIYEFIKDNLTLDIEEGGWESDYYSNNYQSFKFKLLLKNPATDTSECISNGTFKVLSTI